MTTMIKYDKYHHFYSLFNNATGLYIRSDVLETHNDKMYGKVLKGSEPFSSSYPELLDVGIMQTCVCASRCNVDCYQKAAERKGNNMRIEDFEEIVKQGEGKCFTYALGGAGDPDTHEDFEGILDLCRKYKAVPNFTTSGIAMTRDKAKICKKYCGAVAISEHFADYTDKALDMLLEEGVKTNLHYVLSKKSISTAIDRLKKKSFKAGLNAVIFLLYKPVGYGRRENVLSVNDPEVREFFKVIDEIDEIDEIGGIEGIDEINKGKDTSSTTLKIGFDSCSIPGLINYTHNIMPESMDTCEGARWSAYIDASMNMMPCSFANQSPEWFVSLREYSIQEAWNSEIFDRFRRRLLYSCPKCEDRRDCFGGCPLMEDVVLCGKKERYRCL